MVSKRTRANSNLGTRLSAIQEGMEAIEGRARASTPTNETSRLEALERRVELLGSANYRREQDIFTLGEDYATGLLDPTYLYRNSEGSAFVYVYGTQTASKCEWATTYRPSAPRAVRLAKLPNNKYLIIGQTHEAKAINPLAGLYPITLGTNWWTYNERLNSVSWSNPRVAVTPAGIVSLRGLIVKTGSIATNEIIAQIPSAVAPDHDQYFYVSNSDIARGVLLKSTGDIVATGGGWAADSYVSLDTIRYPAKGVASWTDIGAGGSSWGANFEDYNYAGVPAQFWKDPYGFVWLRGLAKVKVATSTDNTVIVTLPSTHRSYVEQHFRTVANDGYGGIGSGPNGATPANPGIVWKTGTVGTVGAWISLSGALLCTSEANTINTWWTLPFGLNGWQNNSATLQPLIGGTRRQDGLVVLRGLAALGSYGVKMGNVPAELIPERNLLLDTISSNTRGRLDVRGLTGAPTTDDIGSLYMNQGGASSWFSLDGLSYVP